MKKGKYIVFEGISGTGKETQAKMLQKAIAKRGIRSRVVFHPSPELKDLMRDWRKRRGADHISIVYLLLADRYDRVRQEILPALKKGEWVISLRSFVSALVYQGSNKSEREWIAHEFSHFEPEPDYVVYFDLNPREAMERIQKRGEPLGSFETQAKLIEKRKAYKAILRNFPHNHIDASGPIDVVHHRLISCLFP